jgi:hypothetical protein
VTEQDHREVFPASSELELMLCTAKKSLEIYGIHLNVYMRLYLKSKNLKYFLRGS